MRFSILRTSLRGGNLPTRHLVVYRGCGGRASKTYFHTTPARGIIKPYLLADIGEGITECRIVQWFVKPGDLVNQFDAICEVQSDKASVEITSRYDGVIASIHHEVDDMAEVGKPLLDIDVDDDLSGSQGPPTQLTANDVAAGEDTSTEAASIAEAPSDTNTLHDLPNAVSEPGARNSGLVGPAVRAMLKQHKIDLNEVIGSGKGGRILKEDVQCYLASKPSPSPLPPNLAVQADALLEDKTALLSPIESQMFKTMTHALKIPHFGYSQSVDFTSLIRLRRSFNEQPGVSSRIYGNDVSKLSPLPFIVKALSQAFLRYPKLNAHLHTENDMQKPQLVVKASHHFGIAVDTPSGLLVPVIKDVQNRSILSIAAEIKRLSTLAKEGRLAPSDMSGATFTVSNIGSIGGSVVNPVIVPPTVSIVALGKIEEVPVFSKTNKNGDCPIIKREKAVLSWSADHRVLDGASVARCAELVARILENIETIGIGLR